MVSQSTVKHRRHILRVYRYFVIDLSHVVLERMIPFVDHACVGRLPNFVDFVNFSQIFVDVCSMF